MKQRIYIHPLVVRSRLRRLSLKERSWADRVINGTGAPMHGIIIVPNGIPASPLTAQDLIEVRRHWEEHQRNHLLWAIERGNEVIRNNTRPHIFDGDWGPPMPDDSAEST